MRSIICISLLALATPATAQDILSCYARDYSDAHLAKNPKQVVDEIVFAFRDFGGETHVGMAVKVANGGHARDGDLVGQWLDQGMFCYDGKADTIGVKCAIDCDGGVLEVTKVTPDSLIFRTEYLTVGETEECGGSIDIAEEVGKATLYRMNRVDPQFCEARLP